MPGDSGPGPHIKALVATYLLILLVAGMNGWEAWPVTGWRLFSRERVRHAETWNLTWTDEEGKERPFPFADLPFAYAGAVHVLSRFQRETPERQRDICEAWTAALVGRGMQPAKLTIYKTSTDLSRLSRSRKPRPLRAPKYSCDSGGAIPLS